MYSALWCLFFFFKQKTAYELRISDWSSDVCSSDLLCRGRLLEHARRRGVRLHDQHTARALLPSGTQHHRGPCPCRAVRGLWLPGAGFTLLVLPYIRPPFAFHERLMQTGFWGLKAGKIGRAPVWTSVTNAHTL